MTLGVQGRPPFHPWQRRQIKVAENTAGLDAVDEGSYEDGEAAGHKPEADTWAMRARTLRLPTATGMS